MLKGKTVLGDLLEEKNTKIVSVKAKVSEDTQEKIKVICERFGIKEDEYLGKLIEASEIEKVFMSIKKEMNNQSKKTRDFEDETAKE